VVPGNIAIGANTATKTIDVAITAPVTSRMLATAAARASRPRSCISRSTFSITTMASSTTRPVARVRPNRVKVLIENPNSSTKAKVPTKDTGRVSATMTTLRQPWRNRKITAITRTTASMSVVTTSSTEARTAKRGVGARGVAQAGREAGRASGQLGDHRVADLEGVGGRELEHAQADAGPAVEQHRGAVALGAQLDPTDVAQADQLAVVAALDHDRRSNSPGSIKRPWARTASWYG
jgi:hypothetical protein